jgi:ligand-binding sensor domain-containing protein
MGTALSRRHAVIVCLAIAVAWAASGVSAAPKWKSYVDPSLISGIAARGGDLYLATTGGLIVYHTSTETYEQYNNTIGLPSNFLTCLVFDAKGKLWVGTETAGIARLDGTPGSWTVTPLSSTFHGLSDDRINDIAVWGDSLVYATENGAGLIIEDFPGARFYERNGLPSDIVNAVLPDGDRVWMATDEGVVYVDKFGFITSPTDTLFPGFSLVRTDTALYVGTDRGVARLVNGTTEWVFEQIEDPYRPVFSLASDGERLWAGSRARILRNDGAGWSQTPLFDFYAKNGLSNSNCEVRAILPLGGGAAYVGAGDPVSQRRGVHLLEFDGAQIADFPFNGIPANRVLRLDFDVDESLWISTAGFGVSKLTPAGEWFSYNVAAGDENLSAPFNLTLLADSQGSKWFARQRYPLQTPTPLDELQDQLDTDRSNDVWTYRQVGDGGGDGLGSLRNLDAAEDPYGNRWFLSEEDQQNAPGWWGINILSRDKSAWRQVNPTSTDPSGELLAMKSGTVFDVAFGGAGDAYLALKSYGVQKWTTGGYDTESLFDFSDDTWTTIARVGSGGISSTAFVLSIAVRSDGVVWIGTDEGLYRYERGFLNHIPADRGFGTGLLGTEVNDLVLDREENLWVATELGLNRVARDNTNDIAAYTTPIAWQTQLNLFFPPSAVSQIVHEDCERLALHPTKDILYIATLNGISELDLPSLETTETEVSGAYLYPNPVRTSRGDSRLKIGDINAEVLVEIFDVEGDLVHRQTVSRDGDSVWDFTTESGTIAASGVYVVRISGSGTVITRMISLIR